jgi:hypothetical protein
MLFMTSGCGGSVNTIVNIPPATITFDKNSTSTQTPFRPASDTPFPTLTPSLTPTSTPTFTPLPPTRAPAAATDLANYDLKVGLNYSGHHLDVLESIQYPNQEGTALTSLVLAVEANRRIGVFQLNSLMVDGEKSDHYSLGGGWLEITLERPLEAGESIILQLEYDLAFPWNGSTQVFGYNNWHMNAVDWYPFIVPYQQGVGWLAYDPANVGEHLVMDAVNFDVTIQQQDTSNKLQIAASAPSELKDDGLHYRLENARTFVFSASDGYSISTETVDGVTVASYYAIGSQAAGKAILDATVQAIHVYSQVFAPYPYESISIVETYYPDGMEYDGMFFLSKNFYDEYSGGLMNNLVMIGIHEVAHQWWFGLVGNDQAMEPWLDETMATYTEHIFYENVSPGLVGTWWNFRVNDFQPTGKIDISIYQGGSFRPYTNAVYLRGAKFMENLRTRMGDENFFAFLKDYASQMSHKIATADDFFMILYEHTDAELHDIIATYFQTEH